MNLGEKIVTRTDDFGRYDHGANPAFWLFGTYVGHRCRPPICSECGVLLVRRMTAEERERKGATA